MAGTTEVVTGGRLVTPVTAVIVSVTVEDRQHTEPVTALNILWAAVSLAVCLVSRERDLGVLLTVVLAIAEPGPGDAVVGVGTLEVVAGRALTGLVITTQFWLLVLSVPAVPGPVTPPLHVDTLLAGLAQEHLRPAQPAVAAVQLVLSVRTVAVSVTNPACNIGHIGARILSS